MMMPLRLAALCCFAVFLLQGCIPSLHPLYTAKDLVTHKALAQQSYVGGNCEWEFKTIEGEKAYQLIHTENSKVAHFKVHLVKLDEYLFFDFYPISKVSEADPISPPQIPKGNTFSEMHVVPVHSFAKAEFVEGNIVIQQFDADWLEKLFKERRIRIKHERTEKGIVLTASTKELQKFILKYAEEDKAYTEAIVLAPKL
ncbi:MAG: hypothetical protein AB8G15_20580 [Saprospiraceae bacterium]